jgi:hypothetical protein
MMQRWPLPSSLFRWVQYSPLGPRIDPHHPTVIGADVQVPMSSDMMTRMLGFFAPAIAASNGPSGYGSTSHFAFGDLFP